MPVHIGSAVLITGDTYEKKAKLLAVGRRPTSKGKATQAPMATGVTMAAAGLGQPRPASGRADRPLLSTHRRRSLVQAAERMDLPGGQARAGRGCDGR